jgi:hypothetical protein
MTIKEAGIYTGIVVHTRFKPKRHQLRYRVFAFLLDLAELDRIDDQCWLFSRNRFNIFSFYDRDHVNSDQTDTEQEVRELLGGEGLDIQSGRIQILCYPRLFGYVFNPLTIYFCYDPKDRLSAIIYEVKNTFGEQYSYVVSVRTESDSVQDHSCTKEFFVSPFNANEGRYEFKVLAPSNDVSISINYTDSVSPVLNACFKGDYLPFEDKQLAKLLLSNPFMTLKVIIGIHFEALRLLLKGLPVFLHERANKEGFSTMSGPGEKTDG